jgi:serine protease AprX
MKRIITVLATALFALGASGQSAGRAAPDFEKVVVYEPAGSDAAAESLKGFDGRLVQKYERSAVVSINRNALDAWSRQARNRGLEIAPAAHFDRIFFQAGITDTRLGTAGSHPGRSLKSGYNGREGVWVVQFIGPILPAWQDEIKNAGATIFSYVQMNALLVVTTDAGARRISKSPGVQYMDVYQPFLKFAKVPRRAGAERLYTVHLADSAGTAHELERLGILSSIPLIREEDALPGEVRVSAYLDGAQVGDVLDLPLVVGISEAPTVAMSDERVAMGVANNVVNGQPQATPKYKAWLEAICPYCDDLGQWGFHGALADLSGLGEGDNGTHHEALPRSRVIYGANNTPTTSEYYSATMVDRYGHATMVTAIMAGDPVSEVDSGNFFYLSGIAPSAHVVITTMAATGDPWEPATVTPIVTLARNAYINGAIVQNHSYNAYTEAREDSNGNCATYADGLYTTMSQLYDQRVIDADNVASGNQPLAMTVSSGNIFQQRISSYPDSCESEGDALTVYPPETLPPATAKNVMAVGNGGNVRPEDWGCDYATSSDFRDLAEDSKRGTVYTGGQVSSIGYIKPDLVAPGSNITSLMSSANERFHCSVVDSSEPEVVAGSGTSFAAPVVAGAALLASRRYAEDFKIQNGGDPQPRAAKPSLIKAMLIAGAKSMYGGKDKRDNSTIDALPNNKQGFGRVALDEVLAATPRIYINESEPLVLVGGEWTGTYVAADLSKLVKMALVWTDPAAQPVNNAGTPLVNDLDLIVEYGSPCARLVGNKLGGWTSQNGEVSTAGGCSDPTIDHANNVEVARFVPASGTFTVKVRANSGLMSSTAPQTFSLVIYNAQAPPPIQPPEFVTANPTGNGTSASISWQVVTGATGYKVEHLVAGSGWTTAATVTGGSTISTNHTPTTTSGVVLYRVRATLSGVDSDPSGADVTHVKTFTDDPVSDGPDVVKALHLIEVRKGVNGLLEVMGQAAAYSGNDLVEAEVRKLTVDDAHFTSLLGSLNTARTGVGLGQVSFDTTPAPPASGVVIAAAHMTALRNGLK